MSEEYLEEALNDAEKLVDKITSEDYGSLKRHFQNRSFTLIAFMLRRYGLEFKGLTYLEKLVEELIKLKENPD